MFRNAIKGRDIMMHMFKCPRCGTSMNPFDTKFHEPFDTYWRCPHCHYSCNGDMSPTNGHAILSNETDWYAQQCITYKDILSQYIHFGMDKVNGMQLIQKFHDEFLAMSNILRNNLKSMLERPSNQSFQVRFNTAYGVTEYEFAKSCIMIEQYKPAALYIGQAMKYVPSSHSSFSMIAELSEEITQKNQELLASKASHEISSLPPAPPPDPKPPAPPQKDDPSSASDSFAPGCLVFLVVVPATLLLAILTAMAAAK